MKLQMSIIFFQYKVYRHYYLCQYLPLTSGVDTVSRSLLKFKRGAQPDRDNWLNRAVAALGDILPTLPADTIIIRALHHNETSPASLNSHLIPIDYPDVRKSPLTPINQPAAIRPSSLDLLGQALSARSGFPYLPALLKTHHPTALNQGLTRNQRESELRDIYYFNSAALTKVSTPPDEPVSPPEISTTTTAVLTPTPSSILLLDDILTTGATILSILKTLHAACPGCTVTVFTLAKVN
jgi:hypothetical protein